jgi:hypothetical protein
MAPFGAEWIAIQAARVLAIEAGEPASPEAERKSLRALCESGRTDHGATLERLRKSTLLRNLFSLHTHA